MYCTVSVRVYCMAEVIWQNAEVTLYDRSYMAWKSELIDHCAT